MKLFNIICILTLIGFSFASCEQYEVIQPETEVATQDLSSARTAQVVLGDATGGHDMVVNGTIEDEDDGSNNTAEICLVDVSITNPNGKYRSASKKTTSRP